MLEQKFVMIFKEEDCQNPGEYVGVAWGCGYTHCRLSAILERFDEVDQSGCQVPSNDNIVPSGSHDTSSHDTSSRDTKSHNPTPSSTTKHLPVGKPPTGGVSKIDSHRAAGVFSF